MYSHLFTTSIAKTTPLMLIKSARFLSGAFFVMLLSACASTPQTTKLINEQPADIPAQVELSEVAFFPQKKYQCGPAALATILDHQKIKAQPEDLVNRVYIPERKGSLQIEMIATARSYGLMTYKLAPELKELLTELANGHPVLVFQNLSLPWIPRWHYAVAVGYDLNQQQLILRSGVEERHIVSFATFEQTWQRAEYWAYVVIKPGQIPVTANALSYTQAANALMKTGFKQEALTAYRQAAQHWPQQVLPQMALGNAEYAVEDYPAAEKAFSRAIAVEPDNAQAWNNLAYTLSARQCRVAAIKAIGCAVRLAPDDDNIAASLKEIVGQREIPPGQCDVPQCPLYYQ
ncbi:PA2778 family cysteine peptidase [Methylophaga sp. OBS4]|uniref:PA2778 family cysteine peptidase n=1 Tax=Methylophaga sp. OBS4 TaxID=2991935 RepID=UPI002259A813|nr:PA2778 family cysteine peptidase [Methylophaga sp. OBS4]MCX4186351.1 PA2778 family cysteine peptidase [Methylophaga sp. OBS4]